MSYTMGEKLKITVFGQSHSDAIGVVIDGLPAGIRIDMDELLRFTARRAPGKTLFTTQRKEPDAPEFLSGIKNGETCGAPVCAVIRNTNQRSNDYNNIIDIPRPGHADYTAYIKYGGKNDVSGGGQFSGRLTAPLCIAGGICKQILERKGIYIGAHISNLHGISDIPFDETLLSAETFNALAKKSIPAVSDDISLKMEEEILLAKKNLDSVGGIIECAAIGIPAGFGGPLFEGVEGRLSHAIFGVPAVKGIEFGAGFSSAELYGSESNDEFYIDENGKVKTKTNNHGGILGGITSGMPLTFRVAVKPTPSIARSQNSVSLSRMENTKLEIKGRHDPCILPRAVPVIEAVTAAVIADLMLGEI